MRGQHSLRCYVPVANSPVATVIAALATAPKVWRAAQLGGNRFVRALAGARCHVVVVVMATGVVVLAHEIIVLVGQQSKTPARGVK